MLKKRRLLIGLILVGLAASYVSGFLGPQKVHAADEGFTIKAINYSTLQVNFTHTGNGFEAQQGTYKLSGEDFNDSELFFIGNNGGQRLYYTLAGADRKNACVPYINLGADKNTGIPHDTDAEVVLRKRDPNGGTACNDQKWEDINIENINSAKKIMFNWVDAGMIEPVGKLPYNTDASRPPADEARIKLHDSFPNLKKTANGQFSDAYAGPRCASFVDNVSSDGKTGRLHMFNQTGDGSCDDDYNIVVDIEISNPQNAKIPDGQGVGADGIRPETNPGVGNVEHEENATCETNGFGLNWILCPIFNGVADMSDWLFTNLVEPLLKTAPISTDATDPAYQIWSGFRLYGNIILIIALLVIVFGQSIGGGLIDAYTAKKMLPRVLVSAILINLSVYIVALLVDFTNVVGGGIGQLMTQPIKDAGLFNISPSGIQIAGIVGGAGAVTIAAFLTGILFTGAIGAAAGFIGLFVLLPAVLGLLGAFVTLIIRKGLILFLVLVSPVAFALYCLPNTEKYFKKWWDLLFKTLLVYPIVVVIFAIADIMTVTIMRANGLGDKSLLDPETAALATSHVLAAIIAFVLQFLPLVMIPFAFKFAGGAVGSLFTALSGYGKKGSEFIKGDARDPMSRQSMARRRLRGSNLTGRENMVQRGISLDKQGGIKGIFGRRLAGLAGGTNYEYKRSIMNKEEGELRKAHTDTGADNLVRAVFGKQMKYRVKDKKGNVVGERSGWFGLGTKMDENGYAIGKNEPDFSNYERARSVQLYGRDASNYQGALEYEIGKASDREEHNELMSRHLDNLETLGLSDYGGAGAWIGARFAQQNFYKDGKHTRVKTDTSGAIDRNFQQKGTTLPAGYERGRRAFTRDVSENVSNWGLGNMKTQTVEALLEDYNWADKVLGDDTSHGYFEGLDGSKVAAMKDEAREVKDNVTLTADSLNMRYQQNGSYAQEGEQPVSGAQTGAAGRVNEAIGRLVKRASTPTPPPRAPGP